MTAVATIWSGFVGLFIDDLPYAGAIVAWLVACRLVLHRLPLPTSLPPLLLFAGLATILIAGAWAKKGRSTQ